MIHLILGPDASMVRQAVRERVQASDPDGQSTSVLDGKSVSLNDVLMAAASIGFFSAGRTIVVEDLIQRYARGPGGKASEAEWKALFTGVPVESTLILADPATLTVPAAVKKALPSTAEVLACDPPRGGQLVEWIVSRAKASGGTIDRQVATTLARTLYPTSWNEKNRNPAFDRPPDMEALGNEVDKLVLAAWPDPVTPVHIGRLVAAGDSDQIFAFIDAATAGNVERAIPELDRLLAAGEDPFKILSQLAGSVELAGAMATAERREPAQVGRDLKLPNPARMGAIARSVRSQPHGFALRAVRVLTETDRKIKTGEYRDPVSALYATVAGIAALRR